MYQLLEKSLQEKTPIYSEQTDDILSIKNVEQVTSKQILCEVLIVDRSFVANDY